MEYSKAKFLNEYDFDVPIGAFDIPLSPNFPFPKGLNLTTGAITTSPDPVAKLDPNATEQYASNFREGEANEDAMQDYFKGQKNGDNLAVWAKANPALAFKEYSKGMAKERAADMAAYEEDYGSPMNQQTEFVFEQGKPTVTTTSQFDVLNDPSELGTAGKSAYDLAMANDNFIGQRDIPETGNTQDFLSKQMKQYGLIDVGENSTGDEVSSIPKTGPNPITGPILKTGPIRTGYANPFGNDGREDEIARIMGIPDYRYLSGKYGVDSEGSFPQYPIGPVHGSYPTKQQYPMRDYLG